MPTYGSTINTPSTLKGYITRMESAVWLGTDYLWNSLEKSSQTYQTYGIPIGLDVSGGKAVQLGILDALGFAYSPTMEAMESANMAMGVVYDLTGEELTVTTTIREFKPEVLEVAINNGVMWKLQDEVVFVFGGKCADKSRPIAIEFTNKHCSAPTTEGFWPSGTGTTPSGQGLTGGVLTVFDAICTSGLPWDDINRGDAATLALEWAGRAVYHDNFTNKGNLASLWLY